MSEASDARARTHVEVQQTASEVFGWEALTPLQSEAIAALCDGRDVVAIMATGSGKSAIYQLAGLHRGGVTLVVSPLIALQKDQISALADAGVGAVAINSQQRAAERRDAWERLESGQARFVFSAPEQLTDDDLLRSLAALDITLLVVDEAHCVSAWGHDFRPDYVRLADVRTRLGDLPIAALTATASPPVRQEISERLSLTDPLMIAGGFDRPEIRLEVVERLTGNDKRKRIVEHVCALDVPGLVYTATRKDAEAYANELAGRGIRSAAYHAGLGKAEREEVHERFLDNSVDVVVATSAFGMGIDKPDVRFVVHTAAPDSLDSYYQQIGRGGRDGQATIATLFYRPEDLALGRLFTTQRPDKEMLREVYEALNKTGPIRLGALRDHLGTRSRALTNALNLLERADVVTATRDGFAARGVRVGEAVARAAEVTKQGEEFDRTRVEMMREYAETKQCRRRFLLSYFGEVRTDPCGNCEVCLRPGPQPSSAVDGPFDAESRVQHTEWGGGTVMNIDTDRLTVLFDEHGYRTLSVDAVTSNNILVPE